MNNNGSIAKIPVLQRATVKILLVMRARAKRFCERAVIVIETALMRLLPRMPIGPASANA
jgi:hypothetical protein